MKNKPYILVVDDEPLNRLVIQSFLEDNYEVTSVNNGQECLNRLSERLPDLIITDIEKPVMDGLEACKQLRADDRFMHIPVIFMSTLKGDEVENRCSDAGGNHFFQKPVDKFELNSKIKELTGNPKLINS